MRWNPDGLFLDCWNPEDERIIQPKHYGIGWSLNMHAILSKMGCVSDDAEPEPQHVQDQKEKLLDSPTRKDN
eukprot:CAMPEP_0182424060 /NCGR_PEP_ID=MMETSP1167-20130531/10204_1 /TAXON_ID=2988 /ORGANISM="Mallomonas Sp, Strain CCMP3275" /LENGTH=71 /DNA_ID=CAMNT_0024603573 /DNA_START=192 /DNA_END=407 /DNA_ORIENTATION=-